MNRTIAKLILAATAAASAMGMAGTASAHEGEYHRHPARAEIHHRIHHQAHRIDRAEREGRITHGEARHMRHHLRDIRHEERADARANHDGGRLTPDQARGMNHQLDHTGQAIPR